jgi:D-alanyl-D-alanine carboxypeptidase
MWWRTWAAAAVLSLLVGCQPSPPAVSPPAARSDVSLPLPAAMPTAEPTPFQQAPSPPTPVAARQVAAPAGAVAIGTPRAAEVIDVTYTSTFTPTPRPTLAPTATSVPPSPTPAPPTPTPDAARAAQQRFCDAAAPPARLALPPLAPFVHIPAPLVQSQPTPVAGGPRQEGSESAPNVTASSVVVLDDASGKLLYGREAFMRRAPASVTKIATTMVALERGPDLNGVLTTTVSAAALLQCDGSSVMGLEPNDHVKLETLLYGMMLPSGNDAAEQVAFSLAGSRERYVGWMNDKVASLGLRDTHFVTPSGMDSDEHYSTAYDMALLGRYAMSNPRFRTLAATPFFVGDDYYMHNLNPLLGSYEGADGVKVGYTEIAGRTMVASATRGGHRVYVSLMGSRALAADAIALFDWVWRTFRW